MTFLNDLRIYLEKECHIISDPQSAIDEAISVLEFFEKWTQDNEPYAVNTIDTLSAARDILDTDRDE